MRLVLRIVVSSVLLVGIAACGGDDDDGGGGGESSAPFCKHARTYAGLGEMDTTSIESLLDGFARAADVYEDLAATAPDDLEAEATALAGAAREMVNRFAEADFEDLEDFATRGETMIQDIEDDYGTSLDGEAEQLGEYIEQECGVTIDE